LETLRRSVNSPDPEVKRRVRALVLRIEKQAEAEELLTPTTVRIACKDAPLKKVLTDFAEKSGVAVTFRGERAKLSEGRVTLDTGAVPFWQALEQLCQKADLAEMSERLGASVTGQSRPRGASRSLPPDVEARQAASRSRDVFRPSPASGVSTASIVLRDREAEAVPTTVHGSLRVRALPDRAGHLSTAQQTGINLAVALEPKLTLLAVKQVRVEKALDDRGQALSAIPADVAAPRPDASVDRMTRRMRGDERPAYEHTVPVRFKRADLPSHTLKELKGVLSLQIMTPPQTVATVENVLNANGQTVTGRHGGALTVHRVTVSGNGTVHVQLEVRPPDADDASLALAEDAVVLMNANVRLQVAQMRQIQIARLQQIQGQVRIVNEFRAANGLPPNAKGIGITLIDSKGESYQPSSISRGVHVNNGVATEQMTLTFPRRNGHGDPAKLVYSAPRRATIEVPFTLRDIKLP
jgi:hypothetical protein